MISEDYKKFTSVNCDSVEGKLLVAALSILTSIDKEDIKEGRFGGMNHPDTVMENIWHLANYVFHEKELEEYKFIQMRDKKIESLIDK